MDLSPGQQKAVFALVVVVLAALGYWLILPKVSHPHDTGQAATSPSPTAPASTPAGASSQAAPPSPVTASPGTGGNVNIYAWLPFTQQGLAEAASVAVKFTVDYNTFTYTEKAADYVGKMNGLITEQLATTLQASFAAPGVAKLRTDQQQVSTGTAAISSIRAFGPSSLVFIVNSTQHLVTTKGASTGNAQYAITLTGAGASWQVNDIELSSAGNS